MQGALEWVGARLRRVRGRTDMGMTVKMPGRDGSPSRPCLGTAAGSESPPYRETRCVANGRDAVAPHPHFVICLAQESLRPTVRLKTGLPACESLASTQK